MSDGKYAAFISYSHKDEAVARWLHKRLERYAVPRGAAPGYGREVLFGRRIGRVFRDREELPAGYPLSDQINDALARSDALIVLCSPDAAQSEYVNKEIIEFQRLDKGDRIFPVIIGGEDREIFPPALSEKREILEADMRTGRDGRELAALKLLAGLMGLEPYDLTRREARAQRRRLAAAIAGMTLFAGLAAVSIIAGYLAYQNAGIAKKQQMEAIKSRDQAREYLDVVFENYAGLAAQFLFSTSLDSMHSYRSISLSYRDVANLAIDNSLSSGPDRYVNEIDNVSQSCPVRISACFIENYREIEGLTTTISDATLIYSADRAKNSFLGGAVTRSRVDGDFFESLISLCPKIRQQNGNPLSQLCQQGTVTTPYKDVYAGEHTNINAYMIRLSEREFILLFDGWLVGSSGGNSSSFSYYIMPKGSEFYIPIVDSVSADSLGVIYNQSGDIISLAYSSYGNTGISETSYASHGMLFDRSYRVIRRSGLSSGVYRDFSEEGDQYKASFGYSLLYLNDEILDSGYYDESGW